MGNFQRDPRESPGKLFYTSIFNRISDPWFRHEEIYSKATNNNCSRKQWKKFNIFKKDILIKFTLIIFLNIYTYGRKVLNIFDLPVFVFSFLSNKLCIKLIIWLLVLNFSSKVFPFLMKRDGYFFFTKPNIHTVSQII